MTLSTKRSIASCATLKGEKRGYCFPMETIRPAAEPAMMTPSIWSPNLMFLCMDSVTRGAAEEEAFVKIPGHETRFLVCHFRFRSRGRCRDAGAHSLSHRPPVRLQFNRGLDAEEVAAATS